MPESASGEVGVCSRGVCLLGGVSAPGVVSAPRGCLPGGGVCSRRVVSALGGCLFPGGVCSGGCLLPGVGIPACTEADTPPC